jgi:hypothetical protein
MLLACAREQLNKIQFFTFARDRETADTHIARALARRFGLDHRVLPMEYANSDELAAWLDRTGDCVSGDIWKIHPTLRRLDPTRALLPGMAGEVARAFYWQDTDSAATRLSPRELVRRCHLPANEQILDGAEAWLAEIADFDCLTILDLMYIEQRLGCWGGPQQYGGDDRAVRQLFPLAHRAVFEAMLALPADYRREEQLARQICELAWPELLSLPFNEFSGWQRYPRRLARSVLRFGRGTLAALRRRT